jgi:hypothetical protein
MVPSGAALHDMIRRPVATVPGGSVLAETGADPDSQELPR